MINQEQLAKRLYDAIQGCAQNFPIGWQLTFTLEREGCDFTLTNPYGDDEKYPSNHEYIHESFEDALEYALEIERQEMKKESLINLLKEDLSNEYYHMLFYLRAASLVTGLHCEEYAEFFLKEAQSELMHVHEFTNAIVYVSEGTEELYEEVVPKISDTDNNLFKYSPRVEEILQKAISMEEKVAETYKNRLNQTANSETSVEAWVNLFYEDQLQDSWKAAQEMKRMIRVV